MHENEHILIGVVVGGVLAFVLAFVAYRVRTGRCSACKKKPATEPAAEGGKNIGMV